MKINTKLSIAALALFMSLASYAPVNAQENGATEAVTTAETASKWQNIDGNWYYIVDGVKQTGWVGSDAWYFMNEDGVMQTGWVAVDGLWYHLDQNGRMQTGWVAVDGAWYYMNHSGGAMVTGWVEVDGLWYFMNHNGGAMLTGWLNLEDTWYFLNHKGGAIVTGWFELDGNKYHFDGNGSMETGWLEVDGKTYYLQADGVMATNTRIDDMEIGEDGVAVKVNVKQLLVEAIEAAEVLVENQAGTVKDYTTASYEVFEEALANATTVSKDKKSTDLQASAALERLENATAKLVGLKADKKQLQVDILTEENLKRKEENYTPESWKAYQVVLAKAKAVFADEKALNSEVTAVIAELEEAVKPENLVEILNSKLALNKELTAVVTDGYITVTTDQDDNTVITVDSTYTDATAAALKTAYIHGLDVVSSNKYDDKDAEAARVALADAITGLVSKDGESDEKKALYAAILAADQDAEAGNRNEEDYTVGSYKAYSDALVNAKVIVKKDNASKKEILDATSKLSDTFGDLVNVKDLKIEIAKSKEFIAISEVTEDKYDATKFDNMLKALKAAEKVLANADADQDAVDEVEGLLAGANTALTQP